MLQRFPRAAWSIFASAKSRVISLCCGMRAMERERCPMIAVRRLLKIVGDAAGEGGGIQSCLLFALDDIAGKYKGGTHRRTSFRGSAEWGDDLAQIKWARSISETRRGALLGNLSRQRNRLHCDKYALPASCARQINRNFKRRISVGTLGFLAVQTVSASGRVDSDNLPCKFGRDDGINQWSAG